MNSWFRVMKLTFNFDEIDLMKFATVNKTSIDFNVACDDKTIAEVLTTRFLGLETDDNVNWKKYIEYIIPKLSSACFAMRTVKVEK
jgi:hypothetical protein